MRVAPTVRTVGGGTIHGFAYRNYSAAADANYVVALTATAKLIRGDYSSADNGGVLLAVGRTSGVNNNPIWVDAEL